MIKKFLTLFVCMACFFSVTGCEKETFASFDYEKNYSKKDVLNVQFRSMQFHKEMSPANQNNIYNVIYTEDDKMTMIDAQFYVENKQNKELQLSKYMSGKLTVEDAYVEAKLYIEDETYSDFLPNDTLNPKQHSIVHAAFYVYDDELKMLKKDNGEIELSLFDETYRLPIKAKEAVSTPINQNEPFDLGALRINVISHTKGESIKPLYYNVVHSKYLEVTKPENILVGVFAEIENTSDQEINLMDILFTQLKVDQKEKGASHITLLSEDTSQFVDQSTIPAHSKQNVLFYNEIENSSDTSEYAYQFSIDGVPYLYTFAGE